NDACRAQAQRSAGVVNPRAETCGLLLRVTVDQRDAGTGAKGDLYFVDGRIDQISLKPVQVSAVAPGTEDQAAIAFARAVATEVSIGLPPIAEPLAPPTPSAHCGVSISYSPDFKPAPLGKGLQVQNACSQEFMAALMSHLVGQPRLPIVTSL